MSILDLRGPEFLRVFEILLFLLCLAGVAFRWLMAGPHDDHPSHEPDLDPLEVAYLAGGARGAVNAAIASLVHRGALRVRGSAPPRLRLAGNLPGDAAPLEAAVYDAATRTTEPTIPQVRTATAGDATQLAQRLEQYQFLLDPMRRTVCYAVPVVTMVALLMLGIVKIVIGVSRDRPVVFLLLLCLVVLAALVGFAVRFPHRTWRGTRLLKRLKQKHAALHATATVAPSRMDYGDLALAYALFGPVVLSMGPLADLQPAMKPRRDGSSCSGGCGGGSCGGGGGGSSCAAAGRRGRGVRRRGVRRLRGRELMTQGHSSHVTALRRTLASSRSSGSSTPALGIGWRPELAVTIDRRDDFRFVEITAEHFPRADVPPAIDRLRERGIAVIPHGISLSLGGAEPVDRRRVIALRDLARRVGAPLVSEHIAFVRAGGAEAGHLLPVPRTRAGMDALVENVKVARELLAPLPLALENISVLFEWPGAEMAEAQFVTEVLERTDSLMLLDVANVWANARNLGGDPAALLRHLPLQRLAYVHVGGGEERDGVYHDTHAAAVPAGVFELVSELCAIASPPGVMIERDDDFPPEAELEAELDRLSQAVQTGARRKGGRP